MKEITYRISVKIGGKIFWVVSRIIDYKGYILRKLSSESIAFSLVKNRAFSTLYVPYYQPIEEVKKLKDILADDLKKAGYKAELNIIQEYRSKEDIKKMVEITLYKYVQAKENKDAETEPCFQTPATPTDE